MLHISRWTLYIISVTKLKQHNLNSEYTSAVRTHKVTSEMLVLYSTMQRFHTHSYPDLLHDPSEPPLSVIPTPFTAGLRGTGVNGCIYMVMTLVSLAVQSALTYVFVGFGTVCFEIRGSIYQRRLRNFRARERRVQRKPATELISIQTSKST